MKKFGKGLIAGIMITVGVVATGIATIKKTIIEPVKDKERKFSENRKKSARKRIMH
ncbi:MAG: DUF3042 family protein [Streptococcaceae bacterium]|jgi:hypothetical protein|nr:DUF3042 family protein [Streptococcaceae bacterium]